MKQQHINIRKTHPNLYRLIMVFSAIYICLGINFLSTTPTFNPYNISYDLVGILFLVLGLLKLVLLNFIRHLSWLRLVMSLEIAVSFWWGIGAAITFFRGQTSLQLPVLYAGLALIEFFLVLEPYSNPLTKEDD